jgi:hypothetical protein
MSEKKLILSLCDHTGHWPRYYEPSLYEVVTFDLKTGLDIRYLPYFNRPVHGILAAPPCTEFCIVAAQYWERKDREKPQLLQDALSVVDTCLRMVAIHMPVWWALENPLGRLSRYLGPPSWSFDPCDYGGWLAPGEKSIPEFPANDAYTKRTFTWGTAKKPETRPVQPIYREYFSKSRQRDWRVSPLTHSQWANPKREGVTAPELRSTTPLGFAKAFRVANP